MRTYQSEGQRFPNLNYSMLIKTVSLIWLKTHYNFSLDAITYFSDCFNRFCLYKCGTGVSAQLNYDWAYILEYWQKFLSFSSCSWTHKFKREMGWIVNLCSNLWSHWKITLPVFAGLFFDWFLNCLTLMPQSSFKAALGMVYWQTVTKVQISSTCLNSLCLRFVLSSLHPIAWAFLM